MKKAGEVVFTGLKDGMIKATAEWAKQTNTKFAALQDWNSKKLKEANQEQLDRMIKEIDRKDDKFDELKSDIAKATEEMTKANTKFIATQTERTVKFEDFMNKIEK